MERVDDKPRISSSIAPSEVTVPERVGLCFESFAKGEPVRLRIVRPRPAAAQQTVARPTPTGIAGYELKLRPGSPVGFYKIHASQGDLKADLTLEVNLAERPKLVMWDDDTRSYPTGSRFRISVGGFPEGVVHLRVYGDLHVNKAYEPVLNWYGNVDLTADRWGQGSHQVVSGPDDEEGTYILTSPVLEAEDEGREPVAITLSNVEPEAE
jgi:hypothetical protein